MNVGIIGGGQLARMMILAGTPLGMRFHTFTSGEEPATAGLAANTTAAATDVEALRRFVSTVDVVTFETESFPAQSLHAIAGEVPLAPGPTSLAETQDRIRERTMFERLGIPAARWEPASSLPALAEALRSVGTPAVVKTATGGYDGRGQAVARDVRDARAIWFALGQRPVVVERRVDLRRELSIIAVRDRTRRTAFYPLTQNEHRAGQLHLSRAPAPDVSAAMEIQARAYAALVLDELDHVGALTLELFDAGGELLANEVAPRVHNSGHWTIEGAVTSQFENHLRAICGLPLGPTDARAHAAMLNLIGTLPPTEAWPEYRVHRYGKEARPERKVGHVTIVDGNRDWLEAAIRRVEADLGDAAAVQEPGAWTRLLHTAPS